jgi:predicted transcriptional regulator
MGLMAMTLRTDSAVEQALERLAARQGVSKHEAALRAILRDDAQTRLEEDAMGAYERIGAKYRDALDRLGSV